ncbi:MAG: hypothetical protein AAGF11_13455 [Myxococcota bacterium]
MDDKAAVIVLREDVRLEDVLAYAHADGWTLCEETPRAHLVLVSRRWTALIGEEIEYVADHIGGTHSLRVTGSETVARRLREHFAHHTVDELLAVVLAEQPDPVACVRVASKLAACRPPVAQPRHLAALGRLLSHPVTAVRRAGIRSAYTCSWPQLRALVKRRRAKEKHLGPQLEHLERYLIERDASE